MLDLRGRTILDYSELTPDQLEYFLKFIWNGVGSREFVKPPQLIFLEASKWHDYRYFAGGTNEDRKDADREFFHHAHDAVRREKHILTRPFYYVMSYVYFYGLKKIGGKAWEYYPAPAKDWPEFLAHVNAYFDREPDMPGRPPKYYDWLVNK